MELTVWSIRDFDDDTLGSTLAWLSSDERERAGRYRDAQARALFVVTRGALRDILARLAGCTPGDVPLRQGRGEGPAADLGEDVPDLHVGVAHTTGQALVAISRGGGPVGIDIEPVDRLLEDDVADRVCTHRERAHLQGRPSRDRGHLLLRLWVRKEALAKADGRGLRLPFDELDVVRPGRVQVPDATGSRTWTVQDLDVGPKHLAALATAERPGRVQRRCWPLPEE